MDLADTPKIQVCIRKRPLSKKELYNNECDIIDSSDDKVVIVKEPKFNNQG